eukprot:764520-Hanusia_phi.AAC.1
MNAAADRQGPWNNRSFISTVLFVPVNTSWYKPAVPVNPYMVQEQGSSQSSVVKLAFPHDRCKTVHFVRHAEATSNEAAKGLQGEARNAVKDEQPAGASAYTTLQRHMTTPGGSMRDCRQKDRSSKNLFANSQDITFSLAIVSPLTRALQTIKLGLHVPEDIPVLALETARERKGLHPCDSRRAKETLQLEYPDVHSSLNVHSVLICCNQIDFSAVPDGEDSFLTKILGGTFDRRETDEELDQRIQDTLSFIGEIFECCAHHGRGYDCLCTTQRRERRRRSSLLDIAHIGWDRDSYGPTWLENAELRSVNLVLR